MKSGMQSIFAMRMLDELAEKKTVIHSLHPVSKIIIALIFIIACVSVHKYSITGLLPYFAYPFILIPLADLPFIPLLLRASVVLPFVIGIGVFNPFFDRGLIPIASFYLMAGWVSFFTLIAKSMLVVLSGMILFATTGISRIASGLRMLRLPKILVLQIVLTYRYLSLLIGEAHRIVNAYALRAPEQKGIAMRAWAPLAGRLLLRAFDRAERVYEAMRLRGFDGDYVPEAAAGFRFRDFVFICVSVILIAAIRIFMQLPGYA